MHHPGLGVKEDSSDELLYTELYCLVPILLPKAKIKASNIKQPWCIAGRSSSCIFILHGLPFSWVLAT